MPTQLTPLFKQQDAEALRAALQQEPGLANDGITYLDQQHGPLAHPLHRLCDAVFANLLTDQQAVALASVLLQAKANINGNYQQEGSTPLIAAASLHCEELGIFYIEQGAEVDLTERNGEATALHWACYCGLDKLTAKLIEAGASLNVRDTKFNCTPTEWALQALITQPKQVKHNQVNCIKAMLRAGADQALFHLKFRTCLEDLAKSDAGLKVLLS